MLSALKSVLLGDDDDDVGQIGAKQTVREEEEKPLSLTLGGVKMIWSKEEGRWVSDTSEMFKAAEEINKLLDENDALRKYIDEIKSAVTKEREEKEAVVMELNVERQKSSKLSRETEQLKMDLDEAFSTIAQLKHHLLDPTIPLSPRPSR